MWRKDFCLCKVQIEENVSADTKQQRWILCRKRCYLNSACFPTLKLKGLKSHFQKRILKWSKDFLWDKPKIRISGLQFRDTFNLECMFLLEEILLEFLQRDKTVASIRRVATKFFYNKYYKALVPPHQEAILLSCIAGCGCHWFHVWERLKSWLHVWRDGASII